MENLLRVKGIDPDEFRNELINEDENEDDEEENSEESECSCESCNNEDCSGGCEKSEQESSTCDEGSTTKSPVAQSSSASELGEISKKEEKNLEAKTSSEDGKGSRTSGKDRLKACFQNYF